MTTQVTETATQAVGVSVNAGGQIIVQYISPAGARMVIDLTGEVERIAAEKADAAIAAHLKHLHGHQI